MVRHCVAVYIRGSRLRRTYCAQQIPSLLLAVTTHRRTAQHLPFGSSAVSQREVPVAEATSGALRGVKKFKRGQPFPPCRPFSSCPCRLPPPFAPILTRRRSTLLQNLRTSRHDAAARVWTPIMRSGAERRCFSLAEMSV